jgi:hypothetical protein
MVQIPALYLPPVSYLCHPAGQRPKKTNQPNKVKSSRDARTILTVFEPKRKFDLVA